MRCAFIADHSIRARCLHLFKAADEKRAAKRREEEARVAKLSASEQKKVRTGYQLRSIRF